MSRRLVRGPVVPPPTHDVGAGGWAGAGALLGFGGTLVALFLPFAHLTCAYCPDITSTNRAAGDLLSGLDGWRLLILVIAGVVTSGSFLLLALSRRQTALGSVVLALAAAALVGVDAANATTRVLGWSSAGLRVAYGPGFYVALLGVSAACVFALLMVAARRVPTG